VAARREVDGGGAPDARVRAGHHGNRRFRSHAQTLAPCRAVGNLDSAALPP
jgi:hypothetical protein